MSSYIPIASQTLGSSASSVTFSSIPTTLNGKTLRDLVLVIQAQAANSGVVTNLLMRINGDTASNYAEVRMRGDGSSASSNAVTFSEMTISSGGSLVSTVPLQINLQIMDFAQTDKHKSILNRANGASASFTATAASAFRWANTSAITSVSIFPDSPNLMAAGSTFSLYGIEG
jgi:hypothetical protein